MESHQSEYEFYMLMAKHARRQRERKMWQGLANNKDIEILFHRALAEAGAGGNTVPAHIESQYRCLGS
jgi:hypothetical protein